MKKMTRKKQKGFTLIEIIVTVSIATILMSIAVPNYTAMIKNNQVTAAANSLVSYLVLARSEALKRKTNVSVCASVDQLVCSGTDFSTGWIVYVECSTPINGVINNPGNGDCDGDGVNDPDQIIKVHEAIPRMPMAQNGLTPGYINFTFSGRSAGTRFTITPTSTGVEERRVSIARTGRVRSTNCVRNPALCP